MLKFFKNTKNLHFIGIGGIGMSGMAEFLLNHGFDITGSDLTKTKRTLYLESCGMKVFYKHRKQNIKNANVIIYSSAIKNDNIEILSGLKNNIPIIKRSELLGELIKIKSTSIAIAGTHGKTTSSSMIGNILFESKLDPTLIIGGIVNKFNSNNISGSGDIIVVEADEYDKSFLSLRPTYSTINNLDLEHLDCYENLDVLLDTFTEFANYIPFYGRVFINNDSINIKKIKNKINKPISTFGIYNESDLMAYDISYINEKSKFKIKTKKRNMINIEINCPGEHNVYNALTAISLALELGISIKHIKNGLKKYQGVKRRFDIHYRNNKKNIMIIDDYAHHPVEIEETLKAAKNGWDKRIIAIFQPHLFSRTKDFYKEFSNSLNLANIIIVIDIFPAREKPIKGISSQLIINELKKIRKNDYHYIKKIEKVPSMIRKIIKNNDMIICMGAGNINSLLKPLIKIVEK